MHQVCLAARTFLPGFFSTLPVAFLTAPLTLSPTVAFFFGAAFFFSTRPAVVALARGLEVLALGFAAPEPEAFLVAVLVLVVRLVVVSKAGV